MRLPSSTVVIVQVVEKLIYLLIKKLKLYILTIYVVTERQPIDLIITKERSVRDKFIIKDMNNNVIFTVKSSLQTIITPRQHRFLFDANGNLILHLRGSVRK